jgi:hypothetical protein
MGVHDLDIARQEFLMPEIVVFKNGEIRATDVRYVRKALPDVSRCPQATFVRPMSKALVAQVVQYGTSRLAIPVIQNDRPPVRVGLDKKALKRAP